MIKINFSLNSEEILSTFDLAESWQKDIAEFLKEWWNGKDYIIAYTSGSTGYPKRIVLKKSKVVKSALLTISYFDLSKNMNALLCLSPNFIAGKLMIVRSIIAKMNLFCVEPSSSPLKTFDKNVFIDFAAMIPLQVNNSLDSINSNNISKLIIGGGAIDFLLHKKIKNSTTNIYSTYGMTETLTHVAVKKINGHNLSGNYEGLDSITFSIDDRGCLNIYAPHIGNSIIITNDIVDLISDKSFNWIGRYDNIINTGGVKVIPEKVEKILDDYINSEFFISSIPDKILENKVILVIEGGENSIDLEFFKNKLTKFNHPKEVYFVNKFVRTTTNKINRNKTLGLIKSLIIL